jgi:peptide/nickel transport system substrate-binding protein
VIWVERPARILVPVLVATVILVTALFSPTFSAPPLLQRPNEIVEATIEGSWPETVDPAWAYDTASGEIISNVYDTLLTFDGERVDSFLPSIATDWVLENITGTNSPEGIPFYYRYVFTIRSGITFQPPYNYTLTAEDVEYSFERALVQDRDGGPQRMFYEPLLNSSGAEGLGNGDLSNPANVQLVGRMIDHAVESNSTHVWFNLVFPGAYAPFPQILCQTWSSIMSKQWINHIVIGARDLPDWSGDWNLSHAGWAMDHTEWIDHHNPAVSPLDVGGAEGGLMYGSGPFMLQTYDITNKYWDLQRNVNYWRGWPADFPSSAGLEPAGYVDAFKCTSAYDWPTRLTMFLNGEIDFCAVPRQYEDEVLGKPGIRCVYPLPTLGADALFFTFNISNTTPYGLILPPGTFDESGIPSDFFGNSEWGIHTRKAFAYAIDYDQWLQERFIGEAIHPATAIIPGVPFYDPSVEGYNFNLTRAAEEFQAVPGLWSTGFTMTLAAQVSSTPRPIVAEFLKNALESLNPKFHVSIQYATWSEYLGSASRAQLSAFLVGWIADYPDPHDFAYGFYYSRSSFPQWQIYSNPSMDDLIDAGLREPDPVKRAAIYHDIQVLAVEDCPNAMLDQSVGRYFERDWVCGWYYNPSYPGLYAYNLWKWYYLPHAVADNTTQPMSNSLPVDVNCDGQVNTIDITIAARAFGSEFGPPIHPRWQFRADINNDRKINIIDIAYIAKYYGKTSAIWTPQRDFRS